MRALSLSLPLLLASAVALNAQPWLRTVAGSDEAGDGGPAILAALVQPEGVAVDWRGYVYIADAGDHRVRVVTPDGIIRTFAGDGHAGFRGDGGPATQAQLRSPYGVAVDSQGNVYIADLGNGRVRRVARDGTISTVAGGPDSPLRLTAPRNVAVDASGALYISDFGGHRIYRVTASGLTGVVAGTGYPGFTGDGGLAVDASIHAPAGLAVDTAGVLYFADTGNRRIRYVRNGRIETLGVAGMPAFVFPIPLYAPLSVALDAAGVLYIADGEQALRMHPLGQPTHIPGGAHDLAVDAGGAVFAVRGTAVYRIQGSQTVLFAGGGLYGFGGDGKPATEARFRAPQGVAALPDGGFVIADSANGRLRRVDAAGVVSTLLGGLRSPSAVAVSPAGDIYFTEAEAGRLWKLGAGQGSPALLAGDLSRPAGVAVDAAGNVYVSEAGANRIRKLAASGEAQVLPAPGLKQPQGLASDGQGNLYVADAGNNLIRKISLQGGVTTLADELNGPCGVAVDADGVVYVADTGFHRIRRLAPGAPPETVAGTAEEGFNGESGAARSMQLSFPTALAWDAAGRLLVADTGNQRIRRIEFASAGAAPAAVVQPRVVHAATLEPGPFAAGQLLLVEGLPAPAAIWFDDLASAPAAVNGAAFLVRIPPELAQRAAVRFTASGYTETLRLTSAAPGLFPVEGEFRRGEAVLLRATGEGAARLPVSVSVGGLPADIISMETPAELPGLLMVGIRIPAESPAGDVPVILRVGSVASPSIRIRVTP